ncbi:hypothetical protein FD35_GL001610 [Furfurilactobacillus rossiae DSM 15814]|uniref:Uncharacterized protein n=1 Tax=Furfurilactobacillus rossiae DSM 15814 TaxID=1114972 RepID=A0A0R1RJL7_9LACO|nr:hypothetical protein FD35_GL001610 [Furfurilactobacillus rossiae DSM 15814]
MKKTGAGANAVFVNVFTQPLHADQESFTSIRYTGYMQKRDSEVGCTFKRVMPKPWEKLSNNMEGVAFGGFSE